MKTETKFYFACLVPWAMLAGFFSWSFDLSPMQSLAIGLIFGAVFLPLWNATLRL